MTKTIISISLDYELITEAKLRGYKLSTILNELLRVHLNHTANTVEQENKKTKEQLKVSIALKSAQLVEEKKQLDEILKKEDAEFKEWR